MKKNSFLKALSLFFVLLAVVLCSACSKKDNSVNEIEEKQVIDESWREIPDYPENYPTEQNIIDAYKAANDPYCWIILTKTPPLVKDDVIDVDGIKYYRVNSNQIVNLKGLGDFFATLYGKELAEILMEENADIKRFVESEDGKLYCNDFSYEPQGYGKDETYTVEKNSDTSYTLVVEYDLLNEDGSFRKKSSKTYVYEKVDGRWLFTRYRVIRM